MDCFDDRETFETYRCLSMQDVRAIRAECPEDISDYGVSLFELQVREYIAREKERRAKEEQTRQMIERINEQKQTAGDD